MSQKQFGKLFHVTRQTVSNWVNEKSDPDLQTLIEISNLFDISLEGHDYTSVSAFYVTEE